MTGPQKSVTGAYAVIVASLAIKHNVFGASGQLRRLFARPQNTAPPPLIPVSQVPAQQQEALTPIPNHPGMAYNPNFSSPL